VHGVARIGFAAKGSRTRLATLYQQAPLRVLFPRAPAGEPPHAVLATTSGGLVGGDRVEVEIGTGQDAGALATTIAWSGWMRCGSRATLPRSWLHRPALPAPRRRRRGRFHRPDGRSTLIDGP
jgi:urease accessory protein UreH